MSNRQVQRDAQRARRREERQRVRRENREMRAPAPLPSSKPVEEAAPRRRLPWLWIGVGAVAVVLVAVGLLYAIKANSAPLPGKEFPSLGNMHINPGDAHPVYNTNPPTSGWHYPTWPQRGIYTAPLPEEYLLHFQEHAGVVVHYNPDKLPADQLKQLQDIVNAELDKGQGLVILAPDSNIPSPIVLTAWQRIEEFQTVNGNKPKIQDFIERLQCNYDPEGVCGPPHGNSFQPTGTAVPGAATVIGAPIGTSVPPAGVATPPAGAATPGASATPAR
jgi:hypothetical protein